jgi:isoleucyl-tRNA synthetase
MQGHSVTRIRRLGHAWTAGRDRDRERSSRSKGKKDIEAYGVAEFNRLCRDERVHVRQGLAGSSPTGSEYWLDYDHPYVTCTPNYIESVWWLLKQLHTRDLLVQGHRVLPYCPRCGTSLSSHEVAQGYEEIQDKSVLRQLPLEDGTGRELVVWTTTPWTLPSNVAVAVAPDLEYGTFELKGKDARDARTQGGPRHRPGGGAGQDAGCRADAGRRAVPGKNLAGAPLHPPARRGAAPPDRKHSVVVTGDFVTAHDGSGIVHLAPAFGADDYEAGKRHGLALLRPVAADGTFAGTTWPSSKGSWLPRTRPIELIIRRLKAEGRLSAHRAVCPRVSPLLALQQQADLLRPRFLVRPDQRHQGAPARTERHGELESPRGRHRPVR